MFPCCVGATRHDKVAWGTKELTSWSPGCRERQKGDGGRFILAMKPVTYFLQLGPIAQDCHHKMNESRGSTICLGQNPQDAITFISFAECLETGYFYIAQDAITLISFAECLETGYLYIGLAVLELMM